jgi:hypothetical protein
VTGSPGLGRACATGFVRKVEPTPIASLPTFIPRGRFVVVGYQMRESLCKKIHRPLVAVARPGFLDDEQTPAENFLPVRFYA